MERQPSDKQQRVTARDSVVRRSTPQKKADLSTETKSKVSALFDASENKPEVKQPVKPEVKQEAKRKLKPEETQAKAKERPENLEPKKAEPVKAVPVKTEPAKEEPKAAEEKPKKKSASKIILTVIIIIAACGLLFSGYKLLSIYLGYKEGSDAYKEIERQIIPEPSSKPEKQDEEEPFSVNMTALKELNPDAQGYLYCKGLLSYPVVQCGDNDYYLTHLFNGEWNSCGCLFIDCNTPDAFEARNCIIYGHNMNDGSMFASLYQYDDESFFKTHKEFDVFTEGHHYIYKVLSLFVTPVDGFVYTTEFASDEDFVNFLYSAAGYCPYETEYGELTADRKVITMSTCLGNDDDTQRFVVMLIRDREVTE